MDDSRALNKLVMSGSFNGTVKDIHNSKIFLPTNPSMADMDLQNYIFPPNGQLVTNLEELKPITLDPKLGQSLANEYRLAAYDESINKFSALEGTAFFTSHSLVLSGETDFVPVNYLTLYFYTRSNEIKQNSKNIKYSTDPDMDSKKDFIRDKIRFLVEYCPKNTILFIDGPLIGGDVYTIMMGAIKKFLDKSIVPIFFVKNSTSNLVVDNVAPLKNKFNSDMHWSYKFLKSGQRTNFFRYADKTNPKNAKIFSYLKGFNSSPQRVEFHLDTFNSYRDKIEDIMNLVYYLLLVQGNIKNPQVRPIAIAEKYARDTLHLINLDQLMKSSGIIPTMNQNRFAW